MKEFTKIVLIITLLLLSKVSGVSQICSRGNYLDLMNSICLLSQTTVGEKSDINQYACSSVPHNAPEKLYSFYIQEACNVQIGLEILNGVDLDLFLFKYSCLAAIRENSSEIINCIASSGSGNTSSNKEAIQIFLQPGEYFLAVDANSASTIGNFNLDITFLSGVTQLSEVFNYTADIVIQSTDNVISYSVYINNNYVGDDLSTIQITTNDTLKIIVVKNDNTKISTLKSVAYLV